MKRTWLLLLPALFIALVSASGCGVGRTSPEVWRDARRSSLQDAYMLTDDTALFLQTDRPYRGSRWVVE